MWHQLVLIGSLGAALLLAGETTHVVKKGETLYQISREYKIDAAELIRANPDKLGGGKTLKAGAKLRIPAGTKNTPSPTASTSTPVTKKTPAPPANTESDPQEADDHEDNSTAPATYVVKKGDTLSNISRRYKISPDELRALNGLKGTTLRVGQKLKVRSQATVVSNVAEPPKPKNNPVATGGQHSSRPPSPPAKSRYLFIDKVKDKIDKPHVVPGRWKYVVVHHSGTPSGNAKIFDYFHRNIRGMENGLAYHFVIGNGHDSGDGEIEVGDRWMRQIQGGHLRSDELNEIALGICFVGDFNSDRPTKKQIAAAIELITYLNEKCGTPPAFKLHREINPKPTECPGRNFPGQAFHQLFDR